LKNGVNVPSKSNKQKKLGALKVNDENPDPLIQRLGSADPDPYQNGMDPQHW
jgi:hypothetical protein